jgi:16S rRNA U516 pseudouridylate synthase RsuA-like enzyme
MAQLLAGEVVLHDGLVPMPTMMEAVESVPKTVADGLEDVAWTRVRLVEGKYHEVRRMFAAVGHHVVALHRERFGPIRLVGTRNDRDDTAPHDDESDVTTHALPGLFVEPGEVRRLSDDEVLGLYAQLGMQAPEEILMVMVEGETDGDA